jgi:hypothetical protein
MSILAKKSATVTCAACACVDNLRSRSVIMDSPTLGYNVVNRPAIDSCVKYDDFHCVLQYFLDRVELYIWY